MRPLRGALLFVRASYLRGLSRIQSNVKLKLITLPGDVSTNIPPMYVASIVNGGMPPMGFS
jgi:hypothetical protein